VIDLLPIGNHACVSLRQSKFRVSFSLVYVDTELKTHIPCTGSADAVQFIRKKLREHADAQVNANLICRYAITYACVLV
jgi:hypothetical protein